MGEQRAVLTRVGVRCKVEHGLAHDRLDAVNGEEC